MPNCILIRFIVETSQVASDDSFPDKGFNPIDHFAICLEIKRENIEPANPTIKENINNEEYDFLKDYTEDEISDLFIVSQTKFVSDELSESDIKGISIGVVKALGKKCERCWKYHEEVGNDSEYPDVCPRCLGVLKNTK